MRRESQYQRQLINRLRAELPGCVVLKNDEQYLQGVPDLVVLHKGGWAMLEVKRSADYSLEPNQSFYLELFGEMAFSAIVYPENEDEVIDALQSAFGIRR